MARAIPDGKPDKIKLGRFVLFGYEIEGLESYMDSGRPKARAKLYDGTIVVGTIHEYESEGVKWLSNITM